MPEFYYRGHRCHYEEMGQGQPLFLLHGNTGSSRMFGDYISHYAKHYHVFVPDFAGHGQSERLERFPTDFWFDEALQVLELIHLLKLRDVLLIGTSGGALAALNVALAGPGLIEKVIADSFEGESPLPAITQNIAADRTASKEDPGARAFYETMHGPDWERVVDRDTAVILEHARTLGRFFQRPIEQLIVPTLFTASRGDEFLKIAGPTFFEETYGALVQKVPHGQMHLFPTGGHPAMLTSPEEFLRLSKEFFAEPPLPKPQIIQDYTPKVDLTFLPKP